LCLRCEVLGWVVSVAHYLTRRYATKQKIFYVSLSRFLWQLVLGVGNLVLSSQILEFLRP
ncbi:TPA: hypothetical protein ACMD03_004568, partial [Vibrio parahaemolyticus]